MGEDEFDLFETLSAALDVLDSIYPAGTAIAKAVHKYDGGSMPTCGSWEHQRRSTAYRRRHGDVGTRLWTRSFEAGWSAGAEDRES